MLKPSSKATTSICVVGTGAVGLLYGGFLVDASLKIKNNSNISFITRSDLTSLKTYGYSIKSATYGDLNIPSTLFSNYYTQNNINNKFDWIILSTKTNSLLHNNDLPVLLSKLAHENSKILCLMNGLNIENYIDNYNIFKTENINGGMAFVCSNKIYLDTNTITIDHSAYGSVLLGNYCNNNEILQECKELLFKNSVLYNDVSITNCLLTSRWRKLAWNIPFNGLSIALGGIPTSFISKNQHLRQYGHDIMSDLIDLANLDIAKNTQNKILLNKSELMSSMWKLTDSMGDYKTSGCLDLMNNREMEYEFMFHSVYKKLQQYNDNKFPYLQSLLHTVATVDAMAKKKREVKSNWNTNYLF